MYKQRERKSTCKENKKRKTKLNEYRRGQVPEAKESEVLAPNNKL